MIDHTGVSLSDFAENKAFYSQTLAPKPEDCGAFVLDPDGHNMEAVYLGPGRA
jgi:catechol 2,3-dioxygenase-like lactoylglutathione lyase family enzyme